MQPVARSALSAGKRNTMLRVRIVTEIRRHNHQLGDDRYLCQFGKPRAQSRRGHMNSRDLKKMDIGSEKSVKVSVEQQARNEFQAIKEAISAFHATNPWPAKLKHVRLNPKYEKSKITIVRGGDSNLLASFKLQPQHQQRSQRFAAGAMQQVSMAPEVSKVIIGRAQELHEADRQKSISMQSLLKQVRAQKAQSTGSRPVGRQPPVNSVQRRGAQPRGQTGGVRYGGGPQQQQRGGYGSYQRPERRDAPYGGPRYR